QADELADPVSRRTFLKLMGASLGLAGLTGCTQAQPQEKIVPYVRQPEDLIQGIPVFYATAMPFNGYGRGLVVRSNMGRPTKAEGNPQHPDSLGATDIFAQAAVLQIYDPDRSQSVQRDNVFSTWEDFLEGINGSIQVLRSTQGAGLRILTDTVTSPTLASQLQQLLGALPEARWVQYEPVSRDASRAGARAAFGRDVATRYDFSQANIILSLDDDFLSPYPGGLNYARFFINRRRVSEGATDMNRLYMAEGAHTITGSMADHRLPMRPSQIEGLARAVAAGLGVAGVANTAQLSPEQQAWVNTVVADLGANRGASLVIAGIQQPAAVHVLAHAINAALGNAGTTVVYTQPVEPRPADQHADMRQLVQDMRDGQVQAIVVLGGNPVYSAPADLNFAQAYTQVPLRVHLGLYNDETGVLSNWHIPQAHFLESWSDVRAFDGTVSVVQPLIEPMFGGHNAHEILAILNGQTGPNAYDVVRGYWQAARPAEDFEQFWRIVLAQGVISGTAAPPQSVTIQNQALTNLAAAPAAEGLELILRPDPHIWDGQFNNVSWLQELPKPITQIVWDNAALVSPRMAERLELQNDDVVELRFNGNAIRAPIWITPGQVDEAVTLHLGYGRERAGRVGNGTGVNAYLLRTTDVPWGGPGLELNKTGERYQVVTAQEHWSMEGRNIVREATFAEYQANPDFAHDEHHSAEGASLLPDYTTPIGWAMSINLNACIGCNACTIACQAENNIPVVGKQEVANSREMHWIRVDRYFAGDLDNPRVYRMPVPCMHCETAPCEIVCPVAATIHDQYNGLNQQIYNRCVGTKYCSNNCPYKVRRFNFFQYNERTPTTIWLQHNPQVTVRNRGVMEKCTYCVQRINYERSRIGPEGAAIRDGQVLTACQQVCPTEAIVFGNKLDPDSRVAKLQASNLNYSLLGELNTRPRTTYLAKLTNPNPALAGAAENERDTHE
ncbi:MAG: 4Fe-4S dicluster domain-containing protein, partial [Chloroflexaceae bacterium]|nr:4Fe-4S dicluster domain-containing protein [Chloroflexaceae bacterium]